MSASGSTSSFTAVEDGRIRQLRAITTLAELEQAAHEIAPFAVRKDVTVQHAANRLWEIARRADLVPEREEELQERLLAIFNAAYALHDDPTGLVATRMADIETRAIDWLWPGHVALRKVTMLAGEGGLGKSTLLFDIAARVSRGGAWPDGGAATEAGVVLIFSAEDDPADTIKPRLQAAGADLERIYFLSMARDDTGVRRGFDIQEDMRRLERKIRTVGNVRLVIMDPVTAYLGRADANSNTAMRRVLGALDEVAARTGVAMLCNTHFTKAEARRSQHRVIGSVAFVDRSRMLFVVTRDAQDRDRRLFLPSKENITRLGYGLAFRIEQCAVGAASGAAASIVTTRIAWEPERVAVTADEALAALRSDRDAAGTAKADAAALLRELLTEGPRPANEIIRMAGAMGLTGKPLRAAREQLGILSLRDGSRHGWIWALPDDSMAG